MFCWRPNKGPRRSSRVFPAGKASREYRGSQGRVKALSRNLFGLLWAFFLAGGVQGAEPYIDQEISPAPEWSDGEAEPAMVAGEGRTTLGAEYTYYRRSGTDQDRGSEQGVGLTWSKETLNHGVLSLDTASRYQSAGLNTQDGATGEYFLFRQDEFPLSDRYLLDVAAGDTLARSSSLVANSYRLKLSSSLLRGLSVDISSPDSRLSVVTGELGRLNGFQTSGFFDEPGWLSGVDFHTEISPSLRWGLALRDIQGADLVADHSSLAGAIEFGDRNAAGIDQFHWLADDLGNLGAWLDGDRRVGRWRNRYGLFHLDPELLWTDQQIGNDRLGGYWQSDFRSFRRFFSLGWDYQQTNIRSQPALVGTQSNNGFVRYSHQVRRDATLGALASVAFQDFSDAGDGYADRYTLEGFGTFLWPVGVANLRLQHTDLQSSDGDGGEYSLTWDQDWQSFRTGSLRTTLSLVRQDDINDNNTDWNAGLLYSGAVTQDVRLDADLIYGRTQAGVADDERSLDANLGVLWQISTRLALRADLSWSRIRQDPSVGISNQAHQRQVFVSLQYAQVSGTSPRILGRNLGVAGSGRVRGTVFFDENRDGIRSPGEEVAANVQLFLDGSFRRVTDANGEYEFWPVYAGQHSVSVAEELLPLPWVLSETIDLTVSVGARGETRLDIPLIRIDE